MEIYVAALDQGTTSSRAILFNQAGEIVSRAQYPVHQIYPHPGWVEHDPMEILAGEAGAGGGGELRPHRPQGHRRHGRHQPAGDHHPLGQKTGEPVYNAIVWQCRRTAPICDRLKDAGRGMLVTDTTGLLIDAYFSGTKIKWILDNVPGARERAERGELLFGTVDSWLIWNLTGGKAHVTDYSNASRTMLFNIHTLAWDEELCKELGIPMSCCPSRCRRPAGYWAASPPENVPGLEALAGIPICGSAGDQPAALFGQAALRRDRRKIPTAPAASP
jgi:glycerol kinase